MGGVVVSIGCAARMRLWSGLAICLKRFDERVRLLLRPTIPDTVASQPLGNERFYVMIAPMKGQWREARLWGRPRLESDVPREVIEGRESRDGAQHFGPGRFLPHGGSALMAGDIMIKWSTRLRLRSPFGSSYRHLPRASGPGSWDAIEEQLPHQPLVETKHRKALRPNPIAPWELRAGYFRVFYDVAAGETRYGGFWVGRKRGHKLYIGGQEIRL